MRDKDGLRDAVMQAARETLEGMAFAELTPCEPGTVPDPSGEWRWARIMIMRPFAASLYIVFSKVLITRLVAGLLGKFDEEPAEDEILDALGELANTMGGVLARLIVPGQSAFELSLPDTGSSWPDMPAGVHSWNYMINEEPLLHLALMVEKEE